MYMHTKEIFKHTKVTNLCTVCVCVCVCVNTCVCVCVPKLPEIDKDQEDKRMSSF